MERHSWNRSSTIQGDSTKLVIILIIALFILVACRNQVTEVPPAPFTAAGAPVEATTNSSSPANLGSTVNFEHLTLEDGLSQSTINAIIQDHQGFIWFGTLDGLNRYDGYEFIVFKHDAADSESLSDNSILALFEDSDGTLWIGTDGGGLNRFNRDQETFHQYRNDPADSSTLSSNIVTAINEDHNGNLWIGTAQGLDFLDKATGVFTHFPIDIGSSSELEGTDHITVILEDAAGRLWIGTLGGLLSFDPELELWTIYELLDNRFAAALDIRAHVREIFEDDASNLWVGTNGDGLILLDTDTGLARQFLNTKADPRSLSHNTVFDIAQDKQGSLWLGTGRGLDRLDSVEAGFEHFRHHLDDPASLSENEIRSIFVDQSGIIWAGTAIGGLNKYDPLKVKFAHVGADRNDGNYLSNPQVWTIFQDESDTLWIGTSSGLNKFDRESGLMVRYFNDPSNPQSLSHNKVTKIIEDSSGTIWVATHGGLNRLLDSANSFARYTPIPGSNQSISSSTINDIHIDKFGFLWVGTAGAGLDRFDRSANRFEHFQYLEGEIPPELLPTNHILSFFEDEENTLWIGTLGGLAQFDQETETFNYFRHDPADSSSLAHDTIHTIHLDQEGRLWIGTDNGLDLFDEEAKEFVHFTEKDGLPNNKILGILEDRAGNLWISTNRGLSRFSPETSTFRNYDSHDGLQSLEFNSGGYYKNEEGEMFFGGINGFNYFNPAEVQDNPYQPPVIITDFQIENEPVPVASDSLLSKVINQTDKIDLSGQDTVFSFELAALHYSAPEEIQYAYFMEGFDDSWNYIGNRRFATYTNLPPGNYTFHAIATNSDGVWNSIGTTVEVNMPYPFWQSWWFAGLVVALAASLVIGAYRLRTRNIAARTRELEELVVTRTAEIEQRRQIAEGLREILILLNSNKTLEESLHHIVSQAAKLTDAEDVIIFHQSSEQPVTIMATNPGGQIRYSAGSALRRIIADWAQEGLTLREPLIIPNLIVHWLKLSNRGSVRLANHQALLGIPLLVGDDVYGGLVMFYTEERSFGEEDLDLGFTFADQAALAIANAYLREQAEETAVATERSRLARELHDAVTQTIFSASLIAETVPPIWESNPEQGRELLGELRKLTRGALAEMRTLLLELRPASLEEAQLSDLINQLAEALSGRSGVPVSTDIVENYDLPVNVKVALYRIAQESLNNVMKHARATEVVICLKKAHQRNGLILTIMDNGRGFDLDSIPADRLGISIIRERAQGIGANLTIDSQPGLGTNIEVVWERNI